MTETRHAALIVVLHMCAALVLSVVLTFISALPETLLPFMRFSWQAGTSVIRFTSYLPAFLISGMLIGYALAFSRSSAGAVERFSAPLLKYIRGALVLALVCIAFFVIFAEGIVPVLHGRQRQALSRSMDYHEFLSAAAARQREARWADAKYQIDSALAIWPSSSAALELLNSIMYGMTGRAEASVPLHSVDAPVLSVDRDLTVIGALDRARTAEKEQDYFNAHYYAQLAVRLSQPRDPNRSVASRLAAHAWNRINEGLDVQRSEPDARLYRMKRAGYDAIQSENYLEAYYLFLDLFNREQASGDGKKDPDVERFLELSRRGVLEKRFFIDETANLRPFEVARDVFFAIQRPGDAVDAVYIGGLTYTRSSGRDLAYLRDFEFASFHADSSLRYQIRVPYVKMVPHRGQATSGAVQPELLLQSVHRSERDRMVRPHVVAGTVPEEEQVWFILQMPYSDFHLLVAASRGEKAMSLPQLYRFSLIAETYGHHPSVYMMELLGRLADPFLILIISVLALTLGWKYRLDIGMSFKAWWILAVPLFPLLAYYLVELIRYLGQVAIAALVGIKPELALLSTLLFLVFWLFAVSVYFTAQRSE